MQGTSCPVHTVHLQAANRDRGALQHQGLEASHPVTKQVSEGDVEFSPASRGQARFRTTSVGTSCHSCSAHSYATPAAANSVCRLQKELQAPRPQEWEHADFSCRQQHDLPRGCSGCMASPALPRDNATAVSMQQISSEGEQKGGVSLCADLQQRRSSWASGQASCPCAAGGVLPLCRIQTRVLCVCAAELTSWIPRKGAASVPRHQQSLVSLAIHSDCCHAQHLVCMLPLCETLPGPEPGPGAL